MSPKISVIIPCHNYACYLAEAAESVLRQSLEDWEAIVIDDASLDNSADVMRTFTDPRILQVFHKENKGNIATYNEAIEMARGEFVVVLSADDRYHPDFLKRTVAMLDAHPEAGMVYTGWEIVDDRGRYVRRMPSPHLTDGVYDELPLLVLNCHIAQCSAVVRHRVYQEVGLFTLRRAGDWDVWLRIAGKYPIAFVRQSLYQYRRHGQNMSVQPETLILTEMEMEQMFTRFFADPTLPAHVRHLERKSRAMRQWTTARLRLMRRDWAGGVQALCKAITADASVASSPRRWVGLAMTAMQGATGRSWLGS